MRFVTGGVSSVQSSRPMAKQRTLRSIPSPDSLDLSGTARAMADHAKTFWIAALICKAAAGIVGILSGLFALWPVVGATATFVLAVLDEALTWRSEMVKGDAEMFRRKVDAENSLGWSISRMELSDLVTRYSALVQEKDPQQTTDPYFASPQERGARRAVENVRESAWWSKHIAERSGQICFGATVLLLLPAILTVSVVLQTVHEMNTAVAVSRVATGVFLLLPTLGLARLSHAYFDFSRKAGASESQASSLLGQTDITDTDAIKLMTEYHLARATAPMLPSLVWRRMRDRLNGVWEAYIQTKS